MLHLAAQQSLKMQVAQKSVPLRHYLKQPRRLVHALMNPSQVKDLGQGRFRLSLKAFQFLMLNIQPVVDLHIDTSTDCRVKVRSIHCQIYGNDFINQRFDLALSGVLKLREQGKATYVTGQADLAITVDLPPMLRLTPRPLLESTGNRLLKGVLATMQQRLIYQLAADYTRWSAQQTAQAAPPLTLGRRTGRVEA